jgi:hypothetical protein
MHPMLASIVSSEFCETSPFSKNETYRKDSSGVNHSLGETRDGERGSQHRRGQSWSKFWMWQVPSLLWAKLRWIGFFVCTRFYVISTCSWIFLLLLSAVSGLCTGVNVNRAYLLTPVPHLRWSIQKRKFQKRRVEQVKRWRECLQKARRLRKPQTTTPVCDWRSQCTGPIHCIIISHDALCGS